MDINVELARLNERLKELKRAHNRLFANQIELEINRQLINERYDELYKRNQYLSALAKFLLEGQLGESPPAKPLF
jgi:hypothetical protein